MNAGLAQKFVRFGTLGHYILKLMHVEGPQSHRSIRKALEFEDAPHRGDISKQLDTLLLHGFIFQIGREMPEFGRSYRMFHIKPTRLARYQRPQRLTPAERQRQYRQRRKAMPPSVFQFRGEIQL